MGSFCVLYVMARSNWKYVFTSIFLFFPQEKNIASVHHTWKGIVYLWGRHGAFERNTKPEKRSDNPDK